MIRYEYSSEAITPEMLKGFFVGWPHQPSPEAHLKILQSAYKIVVAIDDETGNVVGFINAIGDGVMSAYIPLLEVLPEYKNRGIGSELVKRLLAELSDLYMIDLTCDTDLQPFYKRLGMQPYTGMMIRNFDRQDCG